MQDLETLGALFDNKILSILAVLVNDMSGGLYLREISKFAKVSDATTFRIIKKLKEVGIVEELKIKKLKLYKFRNEPKTSFIYKLLKKDIQIMQIFVDKAKTLDGLQAILLHGEESNQRANVLIIGTGINSDQIKEICGTIKERYNFMISPLVLAAEQFQQMSQMGLYSGKEKVLFSR